MIVGYGDRNLLLLALTDEEVEALRAGKAITYEGERLLTKDICVMWGRDTAHVLEVLARAGVTCSPALADAYRKGERTDHPRRPS